MSWVSLKVILVVASRYNGYVRSQVVAQNHKGENIEIDTKVGANAVVPLCRNCMLCIRNSDRRCHFPGSRYNF